MTPLELEILLHYHTMPGDYRNGDFSAPAVGSALCRHYNRGLLSERVFPTTSRYKISERGRVFISHVLETPMPRQAWVRGDAE